MSKFLFVVRFKARENGKLSAPKSCKLAAKTCDEAAKRCRKAKGGRILYVRKLKELRN